MNKYRRKLGKNLKHKSLEEETTEIEQKRNEKGKNSTKNKKGKHGGKI